MFSKNIRTVYLYTVCFITLMMVIGGVISTVNAVACYYLPTAWVSYYEPEIAETVDMTDEEIEEHNEIVAERKRQYAEERVTQLENERIRNLRSIFNSSAVWLISALIFVIHWRKIKKEEE